MSRLSSLIYLAFAIGFSVACGFLLSRIIGKSSSLFSPPPSSPLSSPPPLLPPFSPPLLQVLLPVKAPGIATFTNVSCEIDIPAAANQSAFGNIIPSEYGARLALVANLTSKKYYIKANGNFSSADGLRRPATTDDMFIIQSVTKMILTAALLANGVHTTSTIVDICGPSNCSIPSSFVEKFLIAGNITVNELIYHTSGLPDLESDDTVVDNVSVPCSGYENVSLPLNHLFEAVGQSNATSPRSTIQNLQLVADHYQLNKSQGYKYSNEGYVVLSHVLEHVTGREWTYAIDELFQNYVPNGGESQCSARYYRNFTEKVPRRRVVSAYKTFELNDTQIDCLVWDGVGHDRTFTMSPILDERIYSNIVGQGGMACSLQSLANFLLAVINGTIPNVTPQDLTYRPSLSSDPSITYFGHPGDTKAFAGVIQPANLLVVGTTSSDLTDAFNIPRLGYNEAYMGCL